LTTTGALHALITRISALLAQPSVSPELTEAHCLLQYGDFVSSRQGIFGVCRKNIGEFFELPATLSV
jgi:hypothetical protein